MGLVPVLLRPDSTPARLFFLGNLGLSVNFAFLASDAYLIHHLPRFGFLFAGLAVGSFLHLTLVMPEVRAPLRTHPRLTLGAIYGVDGSMGRIALRRVWDVSRARVRGVAAHGAPCGHTEFLPR